MPFITLSNFTLLVALALSTVAAYYSIAGLVAIFAGAVIPIIIMGSILEVAKITTSVWLRKYWDVASWKLKAYLVPAVFMIAVLTSMGIFGFLSKAHVDQGLPLGDISAKVALFDEKIKTQRENIAMAKSALAQMDSQISTIITKGDSEKSAERSVQLRRQQAKERAQLQKEIETANAEITRLNEERAPIAAELRKTEVEVGPIKYIASLIYGDEIDQNLLEKAVRWMIILLVLVFDPLAIALVLAANQSKQWDSEKPVTNKIQERIINFDPKKEPETDVEPTKDNVVEEEKIEAEPEVVQTKVEEVIEPEVVQTKVEEVTEVDKPITELPEYSYLKKPWIWKTPKIEDAPTVQVEPIAVEVKVEPEPEVKIETEGVTTQPFHLITDTEYVEKDGKQMHKSVVSELNPELRPLLNSTQPRTGFGTNFPKYAMPGDIFVRVDVIPNKTFKFDGAVWTETEKPKDLQ